MNYNIAQPFFDSAQRYPDKLALFADGTNYSYREVLERVTAVAEWLVSGTKQSPKRVGIFGSRSAEACIGVLAAAWVGAAYVPISLKQPELGVAGLLQRSALDALIIDRTGSQMLTPAVLKHAPAKILAIRNHAPAEIARGLAGFEDLPATKRAFSPKKCSTESVAYILYTSGSTGVPKGVMLPCVAVHHLLNVMEVDYPISAQDRVAETTDISFDLSVYNMFATWRAGASLHIVPPAHAMAPAKFVQQQEITTWLSVPSIGAFMSRMGLLKPNAFPSLRYTFFCGEPLLTSVAGTWQRAAPNSVVVNMYGPTEAAVMCIGQEYGPASVFTRDCVAIGRPFTGMRAAIASDKDELLPQGTEGELLLAGRQLAVGYLDDPEKTSARFVNLDGTRWYKTGDLAYCDSGGMFHYLGRVDNQVKILGYRVELEEIECHLRDASNCAEVAAVAWPVHGGSAAGVVAFVVNYSGSEDEIKQSMQQRVASYMVPSRVRFVKELPLNNNGKVDRRALLKILQDESGALATSV